MSKGALFVLRRTGSFHLWFDAFFRKSNQVERKTIGVGINNKALVGGDSFENCCEGGEGTKKK